MKTYYRVQADIDLSAIYENIKNIRNHVKDETKLMAIIKADGYGHGAVAIYKVIDELVDGYGVAIVEEAIELRRAGVTKPILILGVTHSNQFDKIIEYDLTQTVFSLDTARILDAEASKQGKKASVHIKIDTGMSRIGFKDDEQSIVEIKKINELENVNIDGVFTHFANADERNKFKVNAQFDRFKTFISKLANMGVDIPIRHAANSAGIIDLPHAHMDMVRCGIATYGLYPSSDVEKNNVELIPAMSMTSRITYIKEVPAGIGISYNSTYITSKNTRIATIPVGYADGYPRSLSSKGRVIIKGHSVPIVGRVCMDQFMVDITGIEDVDIGDKVTLFGRDGDEYISIEEISSMAGSFNYEFVCDIGKRVPRVYSKDGVQVGTFDYYECTDKALNLEI